jgi:hypothetical protein
LCILFNTLSIIVKSIALNIVSIVYFIISYCLCYCTLYCLGYCIVIVIVSIVLLLLLLLYCHCIHCIVVIVYAIANLRYCSYCYNIVTPEILRCQDDQRPQPGFAPRPGVPAGQLLAVKRGAADVGGRSGPPPPGCRRPRAGRRVRGCRRSARPPGRAAGPDCWLASAAGAPPGRGLQPHQLSRSPAARRYLAGGLRARRDDRRPDRAAWPRAERTAQRGGGRGGRRIGRPASAYRSADSPRRWPAYVV